MSPHWVQCAVWVVLSWVRCIPLQTWDTSVPTEFSVLCRWSSVTLHTWPCRPVTACTSKVRRFHSPTSPRAPPARTSSYAGSNASFLVSQLHVESMPTPCRICATRRGKGSQSTGECFITAVSQSMVKDGRTQSPSTDIVWMRVGDVLSRIYDSITLCQCKCVIPDMLSKVGVARTALASLPKYLQMGIVSEGQWLTNQSFGSCLLKIALDLSSRVIECCRWCTAVRG